MTNFYLNAPQTLQNYQAANNVPTNTESGNQYATLPVFTNHLSIDEFLLGDTYGNAQYADTYSFPAYTVPYVPNPMEMTNFFKNLFVRTESTIGAVQNNTAAIENNLGLIVNTAETLQQFAEKTSAKNASQDEAISGNTEAIGSNAAAIDENKLGIENNLSQILTTQESLNQFIQEMNTKNTFQDEAINVNTQSISELFDKNDSQDALINANTTKADENRIGIENNLNQILATVQNLEEFKTESNVKDADQDEAISELSSAVEELKNQDLSPTIINNINNIINNEIDVNFDNINEVNNTQNVNIENNLNAINNNSTAIENNLSQIVMTAETLEQFMNESNAKNASQDEAISGNTSAIEANNQRDDAQDALIQELNNTLSELQDLDPGQTADLSEVTDKNNEQDQSLDELQSQIDQMQTLIAELSQKLAENEAKDAEQDTAIDQNSEQIVDLSEITNSELWLRNNLSSEELNIVVERNLDLLETNENGDPKYLIAKGRTDGEYHVYEYNKEWKGDKAQYRSITNKYEGDRNRNGSNYLYVDKQQQVDAAGNVISQVQDNTINNEDWGYVKATGNYDTGSPLVLDTNGNGIVEVQQGIGVDLNGNRNADGAAINGDKMLAMGDLNGNGVIDGAEVFGNETINPFTGEKLNADNGFDALRQIAELTEYQTGRTDIIENGVVDIVALQEAFAAQSLGLGLISDNNVTSLETFDNIATINTNYTDLPEEDGDALHLQGSSFTTADGEEHDIHDIWFKLA